MNTRTVLLISAHLFLPAAAIGAPVPTQQDAQFLSIAAKYLVEVRHDHREGLRLLQEAADAGYAPAEYALGCYYWNGLEGKKQPQKAISLLHRAAKHGHTEARSFVSQLTSDLPDAATAGDVQEVLRLLNEGFYVDTADLNGETPLVHAARNGHAGVVRLLLSRGANVNASDKENKRAYELACDKKLHIVAQILAENGAMTDGTPGHNQQYAQRELAKANARLIAAASRGDAAAFNRLIQQGADTGTRDKNGYTPLMHAVVQGHAEVIESLIAYGVSPHESPEGHLPPVMLAAKYGQVESLKALFNNGVSVFIRDRDGMTPLMYAAQNGREAAVRDLISRGAPVDECQPNGRTALVHAIIGRNPGVVSALLENKANPDACDEFGETPLLLASAHGETASVEALLNANARTDTFSKLGWTPLTQAVSHGHKEIVKLLLEHHADVELRCRKDQCTPLTIAAAMGNVEIAKLLLEYKANPNVFEIENKTPLMHAASNGNVDMAKLLIAHKANVNEASKDSRLTALMLAAAHGKADVLRLLIENGANIHARSKRKATALSFATRGNHKECKQILSENRIKTPTADTGGLTRVFTPKDISLVLPPPDARDTPAETPLPENPYNVDDIMEGNLRKGTASATPSANIPPISMTELTPSFMFPPSGSSAAAQHAAYISFEPGSHQPRVAARSVLLQLAADINENPGRVFIIEGHTDKQGLEDYKAILSIQRAAVVRQWLANSGTPTEHVYIRACADKSPLPDMGTARKLQPANHRVEFYMLPEGEELPPGCIPACEQIDTRSRTSTLVSRGMKPPATYPSIGGKSQ